MMISRRTVFEIHRLHNEGKTIRRIRDMLGVSRKTIRKYLENPFPKKPIVERKSKLDPFKEEIAGFLETDPKVSAVVVKQKLDDLGYDGGVSILRDYLRTIRKPVEKQAFIRFESRPGEQMQIDWGHFGSLDYGGCKRKLYAMAVVECYSRMLYVEFVHGQNQETLHQCLLNAFGFFGGTPEQLVVDNMLTAVIERCGPVIRFNDAFLDFLRIFKIVPHACNVRAAHEKGKVENAIKFLRNNFWPLRTFSDLRDVRNQSVTWLNRIANVRAHQTTGERPAKRFEEVRLKPLPEVLPDVRETKDLLVYKDFAVRFDANTYTVPPRLTGRRVILKADWQKVYVYDRTRRIAVHDRCYSKKRRIELPSHKEQVKKLQNRLWRDRQVSLFLSLGEEAVDYLRSLADAGQPIKKNIRRLLALKDDYGAESILTAIRKAMQFKAFGADYIENILYQEMTPVRNHPKVELKDESLNRVRLIEPSLAEYDAYIVKKRKKDEKDH